MPWIYKCPKLAQVVGQALFSVGGFSVVCGLIGRPGMTALNQTRFIGKLSPYSGLAEAYPMYPVWWVPEDFFGYALGVIVAALGAYVALTAKRVLRPH